MARPAHPLCFVSLRGPGTAAISNDIFNDLSTLVGDPNEGEVILGIGAQDGIGPSAGPNDRIVGICKIL